MKIRTVIGAIHREVLPRMQVRSGGFRYIFAAVTVAFVVVLNCLLRARPCCW
jgi:hypothetical protein